MGLRQNLGNPRNENRNSFAQSSIRRRVKHIQRRIRELGSKKKLRIPNNAETQNQTRRVVSRYQNYLRSLERQRKNEQRQERVISKRERLNAKKRKRKEQKAEEKRLAEEKWQSEFDAAKDAAPQQAYDYFAGYGLDGMDYQDQIQAVIDEMAATYEPGSTFEGAFKDVGQRVFDNETNQLRDQSLYAANNYFTPNLGQTLVSDTADDAAITEILNNQYAEAEAAALRARNRDQLNEIGYNAALEELAKQREQGYSILDQLGSSQLAAKRTDLDNIGQTAKTEAANINLGNTFDLNPYQDQVQGNLDNFMANLKTNISGQAGDLFDFGSALSAGGVAQGAQNLGQQKKPNAGIFTGNNQDDDEEEDRSAPINNIF